jgi:hypothetical protein
MEFDEQRLKDMAAAKMATWPAGVAGKVVPIACVDADVVTG